MSSYRESRNRLYIYVCLYGEGLPLKHLPKILGKPKPRPHDHPLSRSLLVVVVVVVVVAVCLWLCVCGFVVCGCACGCVFVVEAVVVYAIVRSMLPWS